MTWLYLLNYCILQWFFVRLARVIDDQTGKTIKFKFIYWIVPTTGWNTDFKYIKKH